MKKLNFVCDNGNEFYRVLQKRVTAMLVAKKQSRYANSTMLFKISFYIALMALSYLFLFQSTTVIAFYATYLLLGLVSLLLVFNISHDAAHHAIFKHKRYNDLLFGFTWNLLGNNAYVWKKYHIESHHVYTNIHGSDIDVLENPLIRMTSVQPLLGIHRYQHWYAPLLYLFYSLNWLLIRDTMMLFNKTDRSILIRLTPRQAAHLVVHKLLYMIYMILLPALLLPFSWIHVLIAFVMMHFSMSIIIAAVLGISHLAEEADHPSPNSDGQMGRSWVTLQMTTSLDYNVDSEVLNWLLGGFNAHAVHHLFPGVCHIHYRDIVPILRETAREFEIPYNEVQYHKAVKSHFRFLKRMGHEL